MSQENDFGISPDQYHAGLDKLWKALGLTTVQDKDVFTLAAERICEQTEPRTCRTCKYWYENARKQLVVLDHYGCTCPKFNYGYRPNKEDLNGISIEDDEGWGCFPGPDFGCIHHNKRA